MPYHLDDIASDLSVLHRIDEIDQVGSGPRFYSLCYRLAAYQGVVAGVFQRQQAARARERTGPVSLAQWASARPDAIREAQQRMQTGR